MLEWRMWTPGGEYMLSLNLKNVSTKPLKLKYKLPATKYFSMEFPEPIILSAGMSFPVKVTFRPVKKETYDDFVEFITATGGFRIPIRATLPLVKMKVPEQLHFGYVPAKETATKSFSIANKGEIAINYKWNLNEPFNIIPAEGQLEPEKSASFVATFKPEDASVFVASAVCTQHDGETVASMKVVGVGKYSHISLETNTIDFHEVLVGQTVERVVRLSNHSITDAAFTIQRKEKEHDRVFRISPVQGRIKASEYENIKISYTPNAPGVFSSESFIFSTTSGNTTSLCCRGKAICPSVKLSTQFLNFGNIKAGEHATRNFHIDNVSEIPILFQLIAEKDSAFTFSKTYGECAPHSQVHLSVRFAPVEAANYWKRVYILVHDCEPLDINLIGTCYDEKRRPPPFSRRHVQAYLMQSSKEKVPSLDEMSVAVGSLSKTIEYSTQQTKDVHTPQKGASSSATEDADKWKEFFDGHDPAKALTVNETEIDYGACSHLRMSEYRTVVLTNRTDYKLTAFWLLPGDPSLEDYTEDDLSKKPSNPVFQIFPESLDIKPRSSVQFKVQFRPTRESQYYCQSLECLAFVKSQRNFRLVSGEKLLPPWTVSVQARGHTFYGNTEEFLPRANFVSSKLNFPPCPVGGSVYLTTVLSNNGDTPVKFEIQDSMRSMQISDHRNIVVKPRVGVIPSGKSQILGLCFSAKEARMYNESLMCILNDSAKNAIEIHLSGSGNVPTLLMDNTLYFKPTCVGALSHRYMEVQNASRIPVRFAFEIPEKAQDLFAVEPQFGILQGNEKSSVRWTMIPNKVKKFESKVYCNILGGLSEIEGMEMKPHERKRITLMGEGTEGAIVSDPESMDFATVCIGKKCTQTLTLLNQAAGVLAYDLEIVSSNGSDTSAVTISEASGILPARAFKKIDVSLVAQKQGLYEYDLKCYGTAGQKDKETKLQPVNPILTTKLKAFAAHPTMQITDIKGSEYEKRFLWNFCGIKDINGELSSALSPAEVELNHLGTKQVVTTEHTLKRLPPWAFQLGAKEKDDEDTIVFIELTNTGNLPTEFKFHYQNDAEVEMENWIDVGEPQTKDGKHHSFIIENKIFDVQPRMGVLHPGQNTIIKMTYSHKFLGYHELPVLLYIKDGKRLNLHLQAETIFKENMRIALEGAKKVHVFNPVSIDETTPPIQVYTLHNKGVCDVPFRIETAPLAAFKEANYGCDIFEFLDSEGVVPVDGTAQIRCLFKPFEHKEYRISLDLILGDGSTQQIDFVGQGFHPREGLPPPAPHMLPTLTPATEWPGFHVTPHLVTDNQLGTVSMEHLEFCDVRSGSVATKLIAIRSNSADPLNFSWQLDEAKAVLGNNLGVHPQSGLIEPGQFILCKVDFGASMPPMVCSTRLRCMIEVAEASQMATQMDSEDAMGQDEEIIAEDPVKEAPLPGPRDKRTSVYYGMTFSTRMKFERLNALYKESEGGADEEDAEFQKDVQRGPQTVYVGVDVRVVPAEDGAGVAADEPHQGGEGDGVKEAGKASTLWDAVEGILETLCLDVTNEREVSEKIATLKEREASVYSKILAEETKKEPEPAQEDEPSDKAAQFVRYVLENAVFQLVQEELVK